CLGVSALQEKEIDDLQRPRHGGEPQPEEDRHLTFEERGDTERREDDRTHGETRPQNERAAIARVLDDEIPGGVRDGGDADEEKNPDSHGRGRGRVWSLVGDAGAEPLAAERTRDVAL